jgi:hypothetical protein
LKNLYINDNLYWLARFPNVNQGRSSYLFVNGDGSKDHLVCANLTQADGYWNGANIRIRTSDWTYEIRTVANSWAVGNISFTSNLGYGAAVGWGFYLDNKFSELDAASEWYYDSATKLLYIYPESTTVMTAILQNTAEGIRSSSSLHISQNSVVASSMDYGITVANGAQFIQIRNIRVTKHSTHGIFVDNNAKNILLEKLVVDQSNIAGINIGSGGQLITVRDNFIHNTLGKGIVSYSANCTIIRNTLTDIGAVPGYGFSGVNGAIAIEIGSAYSLIQYNSVSRVGYIGIRYVIDTCHSTKLTPF